MDIMSFIVENALVPAVWFIGWGIKQIEYIPNKWIPLSLLPVGIAGTLALLGVSANSVVQGVLVTAAAVYGDQLGKQLSKKE